MKKRIMSMMLILILLSTLSLGAGAKPVIDMAHLGSVTITMEYHSRPISGGTLTIYRVADIVRLNGQYSFVYTEDFAACDFPLTDIDSADLADALAEIAENENREGISRNLNEKGKAVFSDLALGLYLVVQTKASPGFYRINPFLVSVPLSENGQYIYDVDTEPKNMPTPVPPIPDETEPDETKPPETEPDETKPPETEPDETKPPETEPDETRPPETEPDETRPPETEPDETEPVEIDTPETEPAETEPAAPPEEEKLPQTGLTNWPIPVLAVVGMILIAFGLRLRAAGKKSYEE